jgi:hypothetical protein
MMGGCDIDVEQVPLGGGCCDFEKAKSPPAAASSALQVADALGICGWWMSLVATMR